MFQHLFNGENVNFDSPFHVRVSTLRKSLGLTQAELAKQVGIVQRLASALGATAGWLASGDGQEPNLKNFIPYTSVRQLPLVTMGAFADRLEEVLKSTNEFHPCSVAVSGSAFSMKIAGNQWSDLVVLASLMAA